MQKMLRKNKIRKRNSRKENSSYPRQSEFEPRRRHNVRATALSISAPLVRLSAEQIRNYKWK